MSADGGGLANFDEDAAIANLSNVGQGIGDNSVDAVSGGAPAEQAPPVSQVPGNELAEPGPDSGHLQPGQGGVDVYNLGDPHELEPLGDVPRPPALTGNQQQDVQNNIAYSRQLTDYQTRLQQHKAAVDKTKQEALDVGQARQVEAQKQAIAQRAAFQAAQQKRLAGRQQEIDQAVTDRAAAAKDLEGHDHVSGGQLVALIAGAFGAALQNYGSALHGGPANAQNQAALAIEAVNQRDYDRKKQRLMASSDALREARYGYKDDADNLRAGLNDIDADFAARQKLIQAEAEAQGRKAGIPAAELANSAINLQARQAQFAAETRIHEREEELDQKRQQAAATNKLAEAHLSQGERQIEATQGYHGAEIQLRREEGSANRGERRYEHDQDRAARLQAAADKKAEAEAKKAEKKANADESLAVRDKNGAVRGYAPSTRVVKPVEDRLVNYGDARESLEELLAYAKEHPYLSKIPVGDLYNRAALAVSAVTTANTSDHTTAMESNTIKNFGLTSTDAIERTLDHVKRREEAFLKQLRPVGGGDEGRLSVPKESASPKGFSVGKVRYEMGDDGNYHKVK